MGSDMAEPLPKLNEGDVWYLAFGSNLNPTVLTGRRRVFPRASVPVKLEGWAMAFNLRGVPYVEPGMASIIQLSPNQRYSMPSGPIVTGVQAHQARCSMGLHGVAHLISGKEWEVVKQTEGVRIKELGYQVVPVQCETYAGQKVPALTLVAASRSAGDTNTLPSARYLGLIREGAKLHGLDPAYCAMLDAHPVYENGKWNVRLGQAAMLGITVAVSLPLIPIALASATYNSVVNWGQKPKATTVPAPGALASNPVTAPPVPEPAKREDGTPVPLPGTPLTSSKSSSALAAAAQLKAAETKPPPGGILLMWLRQNLPPSFGPYFMYTLSRSMLISHELFLKWVLGNGYTITSSSRTLPPAAPSPALLANGKDKSA